MCIRPPRYAYEDAVRRREDIAAVHEAVLKMKNPVEAPFEYGSDLIGLAATAWRARAKHYGGARKHKRRVFDEHRIRIGFERRKRLDFDTCRLERTHIRVMFGDEAIEARRTAIYRAQAVNNRMRRSTHDRPI